MAKIIACIIADIAALIYCIFPLDFIPDLIPVIGFIDDIILFFNSGNIHNKNY